MAYATIHVLSFDYDTFKRSLTVYFGSGGKYVYADVPYDVYGDFVTARNRDEFFNNKIKGTYIYTKIY